jgi:deoxyribodipyrimidine photo-lyase
LSTRQVYEHIKSKGYSWHETEKLIQELAWRDYWQQVWVAKGEKIDTDLKNEQQQITNYNIPESILKASTSIKAIDYAINEFYDTGYMHNHMRMYVASISCNIAKSHWLIPSKWMYANLLDGDLASNQLSWQWVAGAFSNKKYYANQDNINNFFKSTQKNTFLDIEYDQFNTLNIPKEVEKISPFNLKMKFPNNSNPILETNIKTLIYNYYNLDPYWYKGENMQRIFLIEPSIFNKNPISKKCLDFAIDLSKNIPNIKIYVGEFTDLLKQLEPHNIIFKEHPLNYNYKGNEEPRDWMSTVNGYYNSFFSFWKKCKKQL